MSASPARLLVVDDNEMNRDMLSRRLAKRGFEVVTAGGGQRALDLIAAETVDLVLLDIMMPDINGLEVLTRLRTTRTVAELPVIMATAKDQSEDIVHALRLGANDYVTKPLDFPVVMARVETQLQLLRLRRDLEALSKLKDQFLAIASHDLKNPLQSVIGFAMLLSQLVPPGAVMTPEASQFTARIERAAKIMQRIITDFLDFQALEEGQLKVEPRPADLCALIRDAADSHSDRAREKQIEMTLEIAADLPPVHADEARVSQVLQNFIGNAVKFCPPGARVCVRVSPGAGCLRVDVVDSGPGLRPEDFARVFQKYARLSSKPTGGEKSSGLGLSICKQLVELHGGQVGVHNNEPPPGATFWFTLPRAA